MVLLGALGAMNLCKSAGLMLPSKEILLKYYKYLDDPKYFEDFKRGSGIPGEELVLYISSWSLK